VFFLHNDPTQAVEIHEVGQVDYFAIQQHLEQGESIFITSEEAQKITANYEETTFEKVKTRLVTVFRFDNNYNH
jgi:hypothetical protein